MDRPLFRRDIRTLNSEELLYRWGLVATISFAIFLLSWLSWAYVNGIDRRSNEQEKTRLELQACSRDNDPGDCLLRLRSIQACNDERYELEKRANCIEKVTTDG